MVGEQGLLARFREHLIGKGMAPATVVNYIADIKCFGDWFGAEFKWARVERPSDVAGSLQDQILTRDVRAEHVRQYCGVLDQEGRSVSTINRRIQALRKFYDFVAQAGLSSANPARAVKRLDEPGADPPRVLTSNEIDRLLAAVQQSSTSLACRDEAILLLLMETGLKVGELVELQIGDLHFESEASSNQFCGCLTVGQGSSMGRRLFLRSEVCDALRTCIGMRVSDGALGMEKLEGHLFVNRQGHPLSVRSVQRLVSHYAQRAGIEGISTRTLRHTFARCVLDKSLEPEQVARMLGLRDVAGVRRYLD